MSIQDNDPLTTPSPDVTSAPPAGASAESPVEPLTTPSGPPSAETTVEKYLRHIRNVVVAAFVIWIAAAIIGGISWAVIAHDHAEAAARQRCDNSGGIWVNGHCF